MARKKKNNPRQTQRQEKHLNPQHVCEDIVELYLLAIFGFFPLMLGMGDYGYSDLVKTKAYLWFGITALWLVCLGGYLLWCKIKKLHVTARFRWYHGVVLVFLAINILSACFSGSVRDSFFMLRSSNTNSILFLASYAAAFVGVSLFGRLKAMHIRALGFSTFLSGVLSILQLAGLNPLLMYPEGLNYYNKYKEYTSAFLGTLGNVDVLAAFFCFSIPTLTAFALRSSQKCDRLLLIPAAVSLFVLSASEVDAGKIGLLGCLVIALPIVIRDPKWSKRAGIACAVLTVLGLAAVYFWPGKSGFLYEASSMLHGRFDPSFGHDRVGIWQQAWDFVVRKPVLGNGPGSAAWLIDLRTVNEEMNRVVAVRNAHNTYLGYLMDTGIPGLACYLLLIGGGCAAWLQNKGEDLAAALGAGLACYLIQDFFNINIVTVAPFLWIGLGLLLGRQKEEGRKQYGLPKNVGRSKEYRT